MTVPLRVLYTLIDSTAICRHLVPLVGWKQNYQPPPVKVGLSHSWVGGELFDHRQAVVFVLSSAGF